MTGVQVSRNDGGGLYSQQFDYNLRAIEIKLRADKIKIISSLSGLHDDTVAEGGHKDFSMS